MELLSLDAPSPPKHIDNSDLLCLGGGGHTTGTSASLAPSTFNTDPAPAPTPTGPRRGFLGARA